MSDEGQEEAAEAGSWLKFGLASSLGDGEISTVFFVFVSSRNNLGSRAFLTQAGAIWSLQSRSR